MESQRAECRAQSIAKRRFTVRLLLACWPTGCTGNWEEKSYPASQEPLLHHHGSVFPGPCSPPTALHCTALLHHPLSFAFQPHRECSRGKKKEIRKGLGPDVPTGRRLCSRLGALTSVDPGDDDDAGDQPPHHLPSRTWMPCRPRRGLSKAAHPGDDHGSIPDLGPSQGEACFAAHDNSSQHGPPDG